MSNQPDIAVDLRTIKGKLNVSIRTGLIDIDDVNSLIHWLETITSLDDPESRAYRDNCPPGGLWLRRRGPDTQPAVPSDPLTVPWVDPRHEYDQWAESRKRGERDRAKYLRSSAPSQPDEAKPLEPRRRSWGTDEIDLLADLADGKPYRPKTDKERTAINQLLLNEDVGREPDGRFIITAVGIESLRRMFEPYDVTVKYRDRALSQPVDTAGTVSPDAGTAPSDTVRSG